MLEQPIRDHDIAVISTAGRFPGAAGVTAFWANLRDGIGSFSEITDEDIANAGYQGYLALHPDYVRVKPVLEDIGGFDAPFFGFSPREAAIADPQQRIFLECVHEALESAGYGRAGERGRVGVFAGANLSTYMLDRFTDPAVYMTIDPMEAVIGNDKDALTTLVAHRLDLTGPAVSVQTFCSTSAVAIHLACQSLRHGECDMALAGGVCVRVPDRVGYVYTPGGMTSPDGCVRTFDAKAQGGVFGDGSAVVLLKPLRRAIADRDTVHAVIRGSAMNNDGSSKFSYAAPSIVGQSAAVTAALADAEVAPADISYVEAHGTATELGDPIEVAALTRAFHAAETARSGRELRDRQYCAIGSVKTNIGHLDRAATVAGLIKVVEALRNELIPASLNYESPNPEIDFARSPFYVAGTALPWARQPGRPRLAGLNGLGMGGTNVHIVLQEAPEPPARAAPARVWQLLPVSGKTEQAAADYCAELARHLDAEPGQELSDIAFTLQVGRAVLPHRRVVLADSADGAAAAFAGRPGGRARLLARNEPVKGRRATFLFTGVGEHYAGMAADLYRTEPAFRGHLDEVQRLLSEAGGPEVVAALTTEREPAGAGPGLAAMMGRLGGPAAPGPLSATEIAQPAVFALEYALARTLADWNLRPDVVLGYSVGEYVAACLAGVLSLPDAIRLVAHRAALIAGLPGGAMAAVARTWEELSALEPDLEAAGLDLAAVNPGQIVVGGPTAAVAALVARLRAQDIACRELDTSHAFHTRMLEPISEELTAWIGEHITLNPPATAYVSNLTGRPATADLVTDPGYWARHMCRPVRFADALATALERTGNAVVEIGPGRSLGAMARALLDRPRWPLVTATVPARDEDGAAGDQTLAAALGELWLSGVDLDWDAYHRTAGDWSPGRVPVPTYPFQRQRYWFNADQPTAGPAPEAGPAGREDLAAEYDALPLLPEDQWLNLAVWREHAPPAPSADPGGQWVLFSADGAADEIAAPLAAELTAADRGVTVVRPGSRFAQDTDGYRVRPGSAEDLLELFTALKKSGRIPDRVVHLWTLTPASTDDTVALGLHTLVALARAAHEVGFGPWALDLVTAGTLQVFGSEPVVPARATAHGPCTILPVEYPGAAVRVVDLVEGAPAPVADVLAELRATPAGQTVALRGGRRWSPDFEILETAAHAPAPAAATAPTSFREGGVYLITGGLGGIGLALAERIAADHRARLVLLGRTPVPPRDQWPAILADPATGAEVRRRIEGLSALADRRVEFEVVTGDVADPATARRAVDAALDRFGALHGVLHAAGVPAAGMMQFKTVDDMERVLAPKVAGTLALAEALADVPVDFLILFSSIASWTGALGQADYSAANSFLDAFARSGALPDTRVVSIGWGEWVWNGWTEGLQGYEPVLREFYIHHRETFGIGFDAGWRALRAILRRPEPYLVVSTQDFAAQVAGSRSYTIHDIQAGARRGRGEDRYPRPELSTPYLEPASAAEIAIAGIWGEWLGIDRIGVQDNFFDLGGNSLIGVGVVDAVRRALDLDHLPAHLLYQAPTVATFARIATGDATEDAEPAPEAADPDDRAGGRRRHLSRRRAGRAGGDLT